MTTALNTRAGDSSLAELALDRIEAERKASPVSDGCGREADPLQLTAQEMLDPMVVLETVRDDRGAIADFIYVDANQAACDCHGVPCEELIGTSLLERASDERVSSILGAFAAVVETGEPLVRDDIPSSQVPHCGRAGRYDVRAVRVGDGLAFVWRDATARHQASPELRASEKHYRLLAENASDVVVQSDAEGFMEWVSPSVTALVGWRPAQLVGLSLLELVHEEDRSRILAAGDKLRRGEPDRPEVRVLTATGGYHWIGISVRPLFDESGEVVGRVCGWRDAQREIEARQRLEGSEERYRLLADRLRATLDSLVDPYMLVQMVRGEDREIMDFICVDANQAAADDMGVDRQALIGGRLTEVMPGSEAAWLLSIFAGAIDTREPVALVDVGRPNRGDVRFDLRVVSVGDELMCTWRNVTERHLN